MKRISLLILAAYAVLSLLVIERADGGGIYRNRTNNPTGIDSISLMFGFLNDSLLPQRKATGDSIVVSVRYPNGDSAWASKIDSNNARIKETVIGGKYYYAFRAQISDIDGDGREGVYSWEIFAVDVSVPSYTPYTGTLPIYNKSFYAQMDSSTAYMTEEFTNLIAGDIGNILAPCERTDYGAGAANTGRWKKISGDTINTDSRLDTDGNYLVNSSDAATRLVISGDSTICLWDDGGDNDTCIAWCRIDTVAVDTRSFSTFSFWADIDLRHYHEGSGDKGTTFGTELRNGTTPLGFLRIFLTSDSTLNSYRYYDIVDTTASRGWNHFLISRSDFSLKKTDSLMPWPMDTTAAWAAAHRFQYVGFMLKNDSTGAGNVRVMVDDLRYNKRARAKFMFRFDDGNLTQLTHAFPILNDQAFAASVFVCPYNITADPATYLDTLALDTLYRAGWDICNHGWYSSLSVGIGFGDTIVMAGRGLLNDRRIINRAQEYLLKHGWKRGAGFFAWPYNCYDSTAIQVVSERHDFATGGKAFGIRDQIDDVPIGAEIMKYTYPYFMLTGGHPEYDIQSIRELIDKAIERGAPLILGMHGFCGHHKDTCHVDGDSIETGSTWEYPGTTIYQNLDEQIPDDAITAVSLYDATSNAEFLLTTSCGAGMYVGTADSTIVDTLSILVRVRGSASTNNDTIRVIKRDTVATSDITVGYIYGLPVAWTTYKFDIVRAQESQVAPMRIGLKWPAYAGATSDTMLVTWMAVASGDDSSYGGTLTDSSYLRAICDYLKVKEGYIDVVSMSEYFRTVGAGGRLTTVLKDTRESRDSILGMTSAIVILEDSIGTLMDMFVVVRDSLQAVLDTLQLYDAAGHLSVNVNDKTGFTASLTAGQFQKIADSVWLLALTSSAKRQIDSVAGATLKNGQIQKVADSVWLATLTASAKRQIDSVAGATLKLGQIQRIIDSVWLATLSSGQRKIDTTLGFRATLYQKIADSVWLVTLSSGYRKVDSVGALRKGEIQRIADSVWLATLSSGTRAVASTGGTVTLAAGQYTKIKDTVQIGTYTLAAGQFTKIGDTIWLRSIRTLTALGDTATLTAMRDSINAILDTLQNQDNWIAKASELQKVVDTINVALDTLQLHDNWVAKASELQKALDSINASLDSLQLQDDWVAKQATLTTTQATLGTVRDTVNAIIDTTQNQDGWIAQNSVLIAARDTINAIIDTLQLYDAAGHLSVEVNTKTGFTASLAAGQFQKIADSVWLITLTGGVNRTVPNASLGVGQFQKLADSVWLATLSSGQRKVDTTLGFRSALYQKIVDSVWSAVLSSGAKRTVDSVGGLKSGAAHAVALASDSTGTADLVKFFGACDNCYYRLFPASGASNKDSAIVIDPSRGVDSLVGKIIYKHGTVPAVYDTAYFYTAPW